VLVIGKAVPPPGARVSVQRDELMLFQPPPRSAAGHQFSFSQALVGDYVQRVDGLAGAEPWGSWSVGPQVEIEFALPLPRHVRLTVQGRAFGPNAGRDIVVSLGGQQQTLRLPAESGQAVLRFDTDGSAATLRFAIPAATSPKTLGLGGDERLLGIGLESLMVEDAGTSP